MLQIQCLGPKELQITFLDSQRSKVQLYITVANSVFLVTLDQNFKEGEWNSALKH